MTTFPANFFRQHLRLWRLLAVVALVLGSASIWGLLASPAASAAGEELRIKTMKLSVWPEYDDPRLLVIYQGEFSGSGTFPQEVRFRAPKDASIQMACALTPQQEHQCQPYDTIVEGDYKTIVFTLPIPTFYFEYYSSQIESSQVEGSADKSVNYQFVNPPYTVDSLDMEIQQPLKATNFAINPSTTSAATDNQGFKYFNYRFSAVPADKALNFAITYTKTDPNPSVQKSDAAGDSGQNSALIVLAGGGGLAAVLSASYYISSKRKQQRKYATRAVSASRMRQAERGAAPTRPAYRSAAPEPRVISSSASGAIFCSSCGVRLEPSDAFCFSCGQPVARRGNAAGSKRR